MDAYVIAIKGNEYSERVAQRCIDSANIIVDVFEAITPQHVSSYMAELNLRWTWGEGYGPMHHKPYGGDTEARKACALSHLLLWRRCVSRNRPMMILEHDAVFVRPFEMFQFDTACMINDPRGATPRGDWWHQQMVKRGPGVWPKTKVFDDTRPDGLAGHSAYVIKPEAASDLIETIDEVGLWPNDAIMCRQFMDLQEVYPYFTEVQAEQSTI